jgi:hypothetical protein
MRRMAITSPAASQPIQPLRRYDEFIDGFAHLMQSQRGMPLVAGRIFAFLLVCEPAEQTAAQISEAIGASLGTISGMARLLLGSRLIERLRRRGERSAVYRISPDAMRTMTKATVDAVWIFREMTDRGLALMADRPPASRSRLQELRDIYLFFESSLPLLLEQWERAHREDTA